MSKAIRFGLVALASAIISGCGGGGSSSDPPAVASTLSFRPRASFDAITTAGINVNLSGQDTAPKTSNLNNFNDWSGTFSLSKRAATDAFLAATPVCQRATLLVDVSMALVRSRDAYRMQEAATFGYTSDYTPVCVLVLDGQVWSWSSAAPALPVSATVAGNLSGVQFTGFAVTYANITTNYQLTGFTGLDADTSNTAYLSSTYHVVSDQATLPFRMLGENSEFRFKIDTMGKLLGVQYVRTGIVPPNTGTAVTLAMTSN